MKSIFRNNVNQINTSEFVNLNFDEMKSLNGGEIKLALVRNEDGTFTVKVIA